MLIKTRNGALFPIIVRLSINSCSKRKANLRKFDWKAKSESFCFCPSISISNSISVLFICPIHPPTKLFHHVYKTNLISSFYVFVRYRISPPIISFRCSWKSNFSSLSSFFPFRCYSTVLSFRSIRNNPTIYTDTTI